MYRSNRELVEGLKDQGVLKTKSLIDAFLAIDRAEFVPQGFKESSYDDFPIPIGGGSTISQPYTVAFMLENLNVKKGQKVLDIGSGSGWVTALLAHMVGPKGFVWAYELKKGVGFFGQNNLMRLKLNNYEYSIGNAREFWRENAPYDRIISGAAFPTVDNEIYSLIKNGGIAILPTSASEIEKIIKDEKGHIKKEEFFGFMFVPLE